MPRAKLDAATLAMIERARQLWGEAEVTGRLTGVPPRFMHTAARTLVCQKDLPFFINECCQLESKDASNQGVWTPFKLWPAQMDVARDFQSHSLVCALKARQLGFTWIADATALWNMVFFPIATVLLFSKRDDEAVELLRRLKMMHDHLPEEMKIEVVADSGHEFQLANGSRALAMPTTGGRSYTGTLAIVDEADYIPDLDKLIMAVKPTIDAGGRLIMLSTADKSIPLSMFKQTYRMAVDGKNNYHPVFCGWNARPDRTQEWYDAECRADMAMRGSLDYCWQEYPQTDIQALAPRSLDKRLPFEWLKKCYSPMQPLAIGRIR
jgi:hypothetical protein